MTTTGTKQPSALATLKGLVAKKPVATTDAAIVTQVTDPAISGATRKGKTSVVHLGYDPAMAEKAARCAALKQTLDDAAVEFSVDQADCRDYGKQKRGLYNDTYKSDVTTVCIPYKVEVPTDLNSETPGFETRYVQVICSNRYSVAADAVLANKETIGSELYEKLFLEDRKKVLKPNAEELIRGILSEQGIVGDDLESAMNTLFDETVSVKTVSGYEAEERKAPPAVRSLLSQMVTRAEPGLKFF